MSQKTTLRRRGSSSGVLAQNTEIFGTDLVPIPSELEDPVRFIITYMTSTVGTTLEVTVDSGTNWGVLNNNVAFTASAWFELSLMVRKGDLVNFRVPTAGGATIILLRVDQQSGDVT